MSIPHFLSAGIGVQSTTMILMAAVGELEPMPTAAIFADTQDETAATYGTLDYLLKQPLPFPLLVRSKGRLSEAATKLRLSKRSGNYYTRPSLPVFVRNSVTGKISRVPRHCTQDYKIEVVRRAVKELLGFRRTPRTPVGVMWLGISLDEIERMKDSRVPWLTNHYPLVDKGMTREGCKDWLRAHGHPIPTQSACYYCPFHSDAHWILLREQQPLEFQKAVEFDRQLREVTQGLANYSLKGDRYLHRSCVPLGQVEFKPKERHGFQEECEGHCGL